MRFRLILTGLLAVGFTLYLQVFAAQLQVFAAGPSVTVYKDAFCGCCSVWVKHLEANGFQVKVNVVENMDERKRTNGVPSNLKSCHTAVVNGYTIEGHVPAEEIHRLLKERPKAKGLAVPGMPIGSPGMEAGTTRQAFSVLLFDTDGKTSVYRQYSAR
jgi:hypothetical protein